MNKGLEALHHPRIELASIDISAEGKQDIAYMPFYKTKQYAVIEEELKRLEEYDKTEYSALIESHKKLLKEKKANAKKLKALEIIKKKTPDIYYVLAFRKFDTYDAHTAPSCESPKLTKEEFNLLKEVLLYE